MAPLEETVKSDRREFPQEMRSTLDRLWKRGTLPQRAGQILNPRGFQVSARHLLAQQGGYGGAELGPLASCAATFRVSGRKEHTVARIARE